MKHDSDVRNLLHRYVDRHNAGSGAELLDVGVEIEVEGDGLSDLRRAAIVRSFVAHELMLDKIGCVGRDVAFANYAWCANPRIGGLIRLQRRNRRIARITLRPGYSRICGV